MNVVKASGLTVELTLGLTLGPTSGLQASNRLIAGLPRTERDALLRRCETIELSFGEALCTRQQGFEYACFPLTACLSLTAAVRGHPPMEIGMIGNEGMLGVSLLLGIDLAPQDSIVQGPGTALRIRAADLRALLPGSPALQRSLERYLFRLLAQAGQTTVCTRFHLIDARLARWLLMAHDRAHCDHLQMTHQILAHMLGVQRSAVTIASGALKRGQLIDYVRGRISILDRAGLEAAACECYGTEQYSIGG